MYHNPKTGLKTYFLEFDGVGGKDKVDELKELLENDGYKIITIR
ncbi:hypothetical protein R83H12_01042 [Fibrobacteria bacterium R8-3-H12]